MKVLTLQDVRVVAFDMAREMMAWKTRYPNVLESCLATPLQMFNKKALYPGLIAKAAILFYLLIKNHPFENGNKRIAVTSLLCFLYLNGKWIRVGEQGLYNFSVWVASSPAQLKTDVVSGIESFIRKNIVTV